MAPVGETDLVVSCIAFDRRQMGQFVFLNWDCSDFLVAAYDLVAKFSNGTLRTGIGNCDFEQNPS